MVSKGSFPFNNNKKKVNYRKVKNHRKVSPAKHNHVEAAESSVFFLCLAGEGSRSLAFNSHPALLGSWVK